MTSRGWAGFTEEDIHNVQKGSVSRDGQASYQRSELHQARLLFSGKASTKEKLGRSRSAKTLHNYSPIPLQARLSQSQELEPASPSHSSGHKSPDSLQSSSSQSESPVPPSPCKSPTGSHAKNVKIRLRDNNSYELISTNGSLLEDHPLGSKVESDCSIEENMLNEECEKDGEEKPSLEKFQRLQKMMEEQNKHRRELLVKAIADRSRRTQSEAQKLKQIQSELAKLDSLLSSDVSILRDQIEVASLEFNEAQKRYDKAEKEFIEAKLQLFGKLEKKELLTEHLCRIIEANERRKACKLSELMAKLEMEDVSSEIVNASTEEVLPQLASLDEVTYAACTTIKDPKKTSLALQMGIAKINGDISIETVKELLEEGRGMHVVNNERIPEIDGERKEDSPADSREKTSQTDAKTAKESKKGKCENQDFAPKGEMRHAV
ncbi:RAB6-interacting golgin isoform X2 [Procambarus clarkii]|uniref:RAB6-interacting golgin isoform X2 n=1 Tax=Procambarus clarkii TaxID=6728 RepID=UPI001E674457|nr:RAB6-interacting golgin-like isoform X2 [Procambarus clarkii]